MYYVGDAMLKGTVQSLNTLKDPKTWLLIPFSRLVRNDGESDNKDKPFSPFVTTSTQLHNTPPNLVEHDYYSIAEDQ